MRLRFERKEGHEAAQDSTADEASASGDDEPLSPIAHLWKRADEDYKHAVASIVHGIMRIDSSDQCAKEFDVPAFQKAAQEKLLANPRFCCVVRSVVYESVETHNGCQCMLTSRIVILLLAMCINSHCVQTIDGNTKWKRVPVSVAHHIHARLLPWPESMADAADHKWDDAAEDAAVEEYINRVQSRPIDSSRPQWELHLLSRPDTQGTGRAVAILFRGHHSIGDGISLASLLLLVSERAGGGMPQFPTRRKPPHRSWTDKLQRIAYSFLYTLASFGKLAGVFTLTPDSSTPLKGAPGCATNLRKVAFTPCLPLAHFKAVASRNSATINDMLMATIARAQERYLAKWAQAHGEEYAVGLKVPRVRALVIVSRRTSFTFEHLASLTATSGWRKGEWGNKLTYVLLRLPVGTSSSQECLQRVVAATSRIKMSWEAAIIALQNRLVALLSPMQAICNAYYFMHRITAVISNMPGPQEAISVAGFPVRMLSSFASGSPTAVSYHLTSYNGLVQLCITTDRTVVPEPTHLCDAFLEAFNEFQKGAEGQQPAVAQQVLLDEGENNQLAQPAVGTGSLANM